VFTVNKGLSLPDDLLSFHTADEVKLIQAAELERKISSAVTYKAVLQAVTSYYEFVPKQRHDTLATRVCCVCKGVLLNFSLFEMQCLPMKSK